MASRFTGTPVPFFIYSSPSPSQEEEEEQQQIGSPKSPVSVIPVSFFSPREQQIGTPFTPHNHNAPKIMNPYLSISPISSADGAVVLQNLIHIIHSVINRGKRKSNSTPD
ncbi:hypothetical protein SO802_010196 [Lithocarpus litseifolius]|uniref:Uncharacterized protein n=1 Tax=Lithocarpus litseifolius TaxID=425828 RepID=A0AAW2DGL8_9ROSI